VAGPGLPDACACARSDPAREVTSAVASVGATAPGVATPGGAPQLQAPGKLTVPSRWRRCAA